MAYDLERFVDAQAGDFANALAELRAGRKQTHWIWYVFPQLRGLGSSPYAVAYGIDGVEEARAYLSDSHLRTHYLEALAVVHDQFVNRHVRIERLMGSHIDALKLVSSLTLFEHVARKMRATESADGPNEVGEIARLAEAVLVMAETQGLPRCEFTLRQIAKVDRA